MINDEFITGESKTLEFKSKLPDKSETYMKTIVAFANTSGGRLINKMDLIEQWGTGIQRIINRAKEYGLPKPEFMEIGETFRVNLYRKKADKKPIKKADKKPIKKADKKPIKVNRENLIMAYIKENGSISNMEARQILNLAESTTKRFLKNMVNEGLLLEKGERKSRIYVLTAEE